VFTRPSPSHIDPGRARTIAFCLDDRPHAATRCFAAMRGGARGYLVKDAEQDEIAAR
jgi:DNA-binding NarL/FixJ family response regulator